MVNSENKTPGIQSVEIAGLLLKAFADLPHPASLTQLSNHARITPTKARRYLVSLIRAGLVSQNPETGRYELGPLALSLGLAALSQFDVMRHASLMLDRISEETGETCFLSVLSETGASIIQFKENNDPFTLRARVGATLPLLTTATGWAFISFDPDLEAKVSTATHELGQDLTLEDVLCGQDTIAKRAAEINKLGYAHLEGVFQLGTCAISGPVLNLQSQLVAVITVVFPRERATPERILEIGATLKRLEPLEANRNPIADARDA